MSEATASTSSIPLLSDVSDYTHFNANQAAFRYLANYYDGKAIDRSSILYTFRGSELSIKIWIYQNYRLKTSSGC